jgi:hypothetical protein
MPRHIVLLLIQYYCMWQSSVKDEDTPDTRVVYATSPDGLRWEEPMDLALPTDSTFVTPGGWIQRGGTLTAVLNYICAPDRRGGALPPGPPGEPRVHG